MRLRGNRLRHRHRNAEVGLTIHLPGQTFPQFVATTPDGRFAYVSNTGGSVSVVDLLTNSVVGPAIPVAGAPGGIAITADGRTAYVAAQASDSVVAIDTATNTVSATIPVGDHPGFLAVAIVPRPAS